jgi:hypothetical protein
MFLSRRSLDLLSIPYASSDVLSLIDSSSRVTWCEPFTSIYWMVITLKIFKFRTKNITILSRSYQDGGHIVNASTLRRQKKVWVSVPVELVEGGYMKEVTNISEYLEAHS